MPAGSHAPVFTLPAQELQRRLRALIGAKAGLCLSDVARYIGRPYWQVRALAYGERRFTAEDQVALTCLFSRSADLCQEPVKNSARGFRIEVGLDGPRLKR